MSVATVAPPVTEEPGVPDEMSDGVARRGIVLSVALHLVLGTVFILGLPRLFDPPVPEEMPVAVQLVTIAPETRATRPNPNLPRSNAKPDPPVADAPVTKPEPEPPVPTPVPPSSAEIPPPAELPKPSEPKPAPPPPALKPEPKPEPPKPTEKVEVPRPRKSRIRRSKWPRTSRKQSRRNTTPVSSK